MKKPTGCVIFVLAGLFLALSYGGMSSPALGAATGSPATPRHLGIGWAGMGRGFRYWTAGPWGVQAGGVLSGRSEEHNDGYWRERYLSGGVNLLYRLSGLEKPPFIYLSLSVGGEYRCVESQFCGKSGCYSSLDERTSYSVMLLGGAEFFVFTRFGLSAEVGIRLAATDGQLSLWPGFGLAVLFYLF